VYESLSVQGEETAAALSNGFRIVLIVTGWAVGATAVASALAMVGIDLPQDAQAAVGIAILLAFLGMLVLGPIWTIRWLHRRPPAPRETPAPPRQDGDATR
jgi:hypothetical protein